MKVERVEISDIEDWMEDGVATLKEFEIEWSRFSGWRVRGGVMRLPLDLGPMAMETGG